MGCPVKRLLVLDDEPAYGRFIQRIASNLGWTAEAVTDVCTFQARVREALPDAIVLDLQLAGSDGIEQLRHLHGQNFRGAVVLMSGFDERVLAVAQQVGTSLGLAVDWVIQKPARVDAIRAILQALEALPKAAQRQAAANSPDTAPNPDSLTPADVARGLAADQMVLHFQPITLAATGTVSKLEALLRWRRPDGALIMPDGFISLAERDVAVIDALTECVFRKAAGTYLRLRERGIAVPIAVNVSARNLHSPSFPDTLSGMLVEHGLQPSSMVVEITESATTGDAGMTLEILSRLRLKGFRLSMDDFGTGFSSLTALRAMPFSELKIDKSFVSDMLTSRDAMLIVKSVTGLAHELGLPTVAEGVETSDIATALAELGVTNLQGYHISRPLPEERLGAWLQERSGAGAPARHRTALPPSDEPVQRL